MTFETYGFDYYFKPIEEVLAEEPSYGMPYHYDPSLQENTQNDPMKKTPLLVFNEGAQRVCGTSVEMKTVNHTLEANVSSFEVEALFKNETTRGVGKTKKLAQQNCAKKLLNRAVELGLWKEFFLPEDKEEAIKYIDNLRENIEEEMLEDEIPKECANRNYVGELQTFLQRNKLPNPEYYQTETPSPTNKEFTCVCKVNDLEMTAVSKKKKDAKTKAAYKMFLEVSKGHADMESGPSLETSDEVSPEVESKPSLSTASSVRTESPDDVPKTEEAKKEEIAKEEKPLDTIKELEKILKEKFGDGCAMPVYKILERINIQGDKDCIMKVTLPSTSSGDTTQSVGPKKSSRNAALGTESVFCGSGKSDEDAKRQAAECAIDFLNPSK